MGAYLIGSYSSVLQNVDPFTLEAAPVFSQKKTVLVDLCCGVDAVVVTDQHGA